MGLFNFMKDAGQTLFGKDDEQGDGKDALAEALERKREKKLADMVAEVGIPSEDLKVDLKGDSVTITGRTTTQENREKIVLLIGNTSGIAKVDDRIQVTETIETVEPPKAPEGEEAQATEGGAVFHTVARGDTLSAIAKKYYGSAGKYPTIFEANKPMLTDPDKIYPGQVLRIPPQG